VRVLFIDWSTGHDSVDQVKKGLTGGRVTWLRELPDALWKFGIECAVWTDAEESGVSRAGVPWIKKEDHEQALRVAWDALVLLRGAHNGWPEVMARHRVLVVRDLPHWGFIREPKLMRGFSAVVAGSRYAANLWKCYCKEIGRVEIIPNGVDKSLFYPREKDRNYLIFASAPNRGLMRLPLQFDALRNHTGLPLKLKAFSKLGKLHPGETKRDVYVDGYSIDYAVVNDSPIEWLDPIPQAELAEEIGRAGLMLLPTAFPEICSNSVLQALASGTPIITTGNLGATPEWVKHRWNGMLTRYNPQDYAVWDIEMVRNASEVLTNERLHRKLIKNAANTKNVLTWQEVGKKWLKLLKKL